MRRHVSLAVLATISALTTVGSISPAPAEAIQDRYCLQGRIWVSNRIQVRPHFASKNDPPDGAETGVAEPHIAEQSRSWRAASGEQEVMRGS
jgi:hypothetical protein